ncbi:MAG: hypothetical protein GXO64_04560 [Candidatus Micrarchaeota archaeon]|nr:hypothetical protein [Candidatus Micrarchaeota archaeon]
MRDLKRSDDYVGRFANLSHDEGLYVLNDMILDGGIYTSKPSRRRHEILQATKTYTKSNYVVKLQPDIYVSGELDVFGYSRRGKYPFITEVKERNGKGRAKDQMGKFAYLAANPSYKIHNAPEELRIFIKVIRERRRPLLFYFSIKNAILVNVTSNVPFFDKSWFEHLESSKFRAIVEDYEKFRETYQGEEFLLNAS